MRTTTSINIFCAAFMALISMEGLAQTPNWSWAIDSNGPQAETIQRIVVSTSGTIYAHGSFAGSFEFGGIEVQFPASLPTFYCSFLSKMTTSGEVQWVITFCDAEAEHNPISISSIATDSNENIYITGKVWRGAALGAFDVDVAGLSFTVPESANEDIFIAKFDPDGQGLWLKNVSTPEFPLVGTALGLVIDENGLVYWQGVFNNQININGTIHSSMGDSDLFLAGINANGEYVWTSTMASQGDVGGANMVAAPGGGVFMSSNWIGDTLFVGELFVVNPNALIGANADRWVAKIDNEGNPQWLAREGGPEYEIPGSPAPTSAGSVLLFSRQLNSASVTLNGETFEGPCTLLSRYGSDGNLEEVTQISDFEMDLSRVATDGNDTYFLGIRFSAPSLTFGNLQFTNAGGLNATRDFAIIATDIHGTPLWGISGGDAEDEFLNVMAYNPNGGLIAGGVYTSNNLEFGSTTLTNSGLFTYEIFLAALDFTSAITNTSNVRQLHIYPNPAHEHMSVDLTSLSAEPHTLRMFDTRGQHVLAQNMNGGSIGTLDVSHLPKGSYVIVINGDGTVHASKFIKI